MSKNDILLDQMFSLVGVEDWVSGVLDDWITLEEIIKKENPTTKIEEGYKFNLYKKSDDNFAKTIAEYVKNVFSHVKPNNGYLDYTVVKNGNSFVVYQNPIKSKAIEVARIKPLKSDHLSIEYCNKNTIINGEIKAYEVVDKTRKILDTYFKTME